jgi:hypothetical protein
MPSTESPPPVHGFDAQNLGVGNLRPGNALSHADVHEVDARRHRVGALYTLQHLAALQPPRGDTD